MAEVIGDADLILLATPVRQIIQYIYEAGSLAKPGAMIMDVGSTKAAVVAAMDALPEHLAAIGGHPMTGAATTGLAGANATLFDGRPFVLTASKRTDAATQDFAESLVRDIGARLVVLDAEQHDRLVAVISHLPRVLPLALLGVADAVEDGAAWPVAAGGFRESTRKATENLEMWVDVILTNQSGLISSIRALQHQLDRLAQQIESGDEGIVKCALEEAAHDWERHFG
jgi:prephenate dehydrogenase